MPQLDFFANVNHILAANKNVTNGTLTFSPINIQDSLSFNFFNILVRISSSANQTHTISIGLYSLTGSTLSLTNSASRTISSAGSGRLWLSLATSAASNITPGTWFLGLLVSTGGTNAFQLVGTSNNPGNNFPGVFIGGNYSASTSVLPATINTSTVTISGDLFVPFIIITA